MILAHIFQHENGRKTYLSMRHDDDGKEVWSAFVGKLGGNLRHWKTYDRAVKEMELKGWRKIGERILREA